MTGNWQLIEDCDILPNLQMYLWYQAKQVIEGEAISHDHQLQNLIGTQVLELGPRDWILIWSGLVWSDQVDQR